MKSYEILEHTLSEKMCSSNEIIVEKLNKLIEKYEDSVPASELNDLIFDIENFDGVDYVIIFQLEELADVLFDILIECGVLTQKSARRLCDFCFSDTDGEFKELKHKKEQIISFAQPYFQDKINNREENKWVF